MRRRLTILVAVALMALAWSGVVTAQDEDVQDYLVKVGVLGELSSAAFSHSAELTSAPNPTDPAWVADFASIWTVFEVLQVVASKLDAPEAFSGSFASFQASINVMADNAAYCRSGFAVVDLATIETCTTFIAESNQHITRAIELLDEEAAALGVDL